MTEVLARLREVVDASSLPVIADVDTVGLAGWSELEKRYGD